MTPIVAGIVLAGGLSRRMGGVDKSLLAIDGETLVERVVARLRPQLGAIAINANGDPDRFGKLGLPVVADPIEGHAGPLAGVLAGMEWAMSVEPIPSHIVSVACDSPFFPDDLVVRFLAANQGRSDRIVLARSGGKTHPVFGLWPLDLHSALATFMAETETFKVLAFTDQCDSKYAEFDMLRFKDRTIDPFFNANTRGDIDLAQEIALEALV